MPIRRLEVPLSAICKMETQESGGVVQSESKGLRTRTAEGQCSSSSNQVERAKFFLPFIKALNGLGDAHPHWGGQTILLSPLMNAISFRNIKTHSEIMVNHLSGHPCDPVKLTHKLTISVHSLCIHCALMYSTCHEVCFLSLHSFSNCSSKVLLLQLWGRLYLIFLTDKKASPSHTQESQHGGLWCLPSGQSACISCTPTLCWPQGQGPTYWLFQSQHTLPCPSSSQQSECADMAGCF